MKTFPNPLTPAKERECLERLKEGDQEARRLLIEHNMRLVAHVVKKYQYTDYDTEDLLSVGTIGLIKPWFQAGDLCCQMCGKCYPLTDAFMVPNQSPQSKKEPKWHILAQASD